MVEGMAILTLLAFAFAIIFFTIWIQILIISAGVKRGIKNAYYELRREEDLRLEEIKRDMLR